MGGNGGNGGEGGSGGGAEGGGLFADTDGGTFDQVSLSKNVVQAGAGGAGAAAGFGGSSSGGGGGFNFGPGGGGESEAMVVRAVLPAGAVPATLVVMHKAAAFTPATIN